MAYVALSFDALASDVERWSDALLEQGEEDGIRKAIRGHPGQMAKEQAEHHHGHERLNNGPARTQGGLLVTDFDVAPNQEIKQLAIFPKLPEF